MFGDLESMLRQRVERPKFPGEELGCTLTVRYLPEGVQFRFQSDDGKVTADTGMGVADARWLAQQILLQYGPDLATNVPVEVVVPSEAEERGKRFELLELGE